MIHPTTAVVAAMVLTLVWALVGAATAAVPDGIDYQGYVTSSDGTLFENFYIKAR